jgi:hypothetical protein
MRVFGFVRQSSAAKFIMADIMYAFRRLGCEYAWFDMESWKKEVEALPAGGREEAIQELRGKIGSFGPELVISYGLEAFHPLFSDILEAENRPFFNYIPDCPFLCFLFDFGKPFTDPLPIEEIPFIEDMQSQQFLFLCWDRDALDVLRKRGIRKSVYFPMAVNEERFQKITLSPGDRVKYQCDFCFVGGPTPRRIRMLETLHDQDLSIYGYDEERWRSSALLRPHFRHPVFSQEELVKIYNGAFCSMNVTRSHGKSSLNMRTYEAMACGSLLLTDDKKDAWEMFSPGKEILVYGDEEDLRRKVRWVARHASEAVEIGQRGRERILGEHTYLHRTRSTLPLISRFIREFELMEAIVKEVSHERFSEATRRAEALLGEEEAPLNADFLNSILGQISLGRGQIWSAKQFFKKSLDANPCFTRSIRTAKHLALRR